MTEADTIGQGQAVERGPVRGVSGNILLGFTYAILTLLALSMVFPYLWMVANSFKGRSDFYQHPYSLVPQVITTKTYGEALWMGGVARAMLNSLMYAETVLVVQLLVNSLAAFAFARLSFPGRDRLFYAVLVTMMLPGSVTLIPSFLLVHYLGLSNEFWGVVLPSFVSAFGIFLLRQSFLNVPRELDDAATVDGAGFLRIFWQVALPLVKPALITLGVFAFLDQWNSFIWPLVVLSDWTKYPVTVAMSLMKDMNTTDWPRVFAGSSLVSVPLTILFFIAQRFVIGGIALSGMKA